MKMKGCELCPGTARIFCESDQASLCFECDAKVHGANFLVARHSRVLLCRSCQAPTPWKAAGPRLGPTFSVCVSCVAGRSKKKKNNDDDDEGESAAREGIAEEDDANGDDRQEEDVGDEGVEEDDDDDDEDDDDEMESDEEEEEEEEGEEQVVPWSTEPLPPVASSSSSEEESTGGQRFGNRLKRSRWGNVDLQSSSSSQDQLPCSSSSRLTYLPNRTALSNPAARTMADDNEATSGSFRPSKDRKKSDLVRSGSHQLSAISFGSGRPPI